MGRREIRRVETEGRRKWEEGKGGRRSRRSGKRRRGRREKTGRI